MCLASRGQRSDHSLINTSLQRGACGVARGRTALAVSRTQGKKPLKRLRMLALAFRTPLKQGVNDTHRSGR